MTTQGMTTEFTSEGQSIYRHGAFIAKVETEQQAVNMVARLNLQAAAHDMYEVLTALDGHTALVDSAIQKSITAALRKAGAR